MGLRIGSSLGALKLLRTEVFMQIKSTEAQTALIRVVWEKVETVQMFSSALNQHSRLPGSGRPRQTNRREDHHIVKNARVQSTASSTTIQAQIAASLGAPVSSRNIQRCLAEGHLRSRRPLRVLPLTPTHRRIGLEWCRARGNWTAAKWAQVVLSDESKINPSSDENHVRVWRPRAARLKPAFALQRHTASTAGVMVWGVIAYNTWSPLVLIRGTMTAQRYVHDILQPHVLPLMQRLL
ncbi:transposable element Tcb2 transposase [Trichonephila clavipes]|nr:transposable element Tcb2 transposase [Trichonephila clavipes]